jgi:hypothetical protein
MNINITKFSSNNKKLALSMAGILFVLWVAQPYISNWTDSTKTISDAESSQSATATNPLGVLSTENGVADPFKEHIQQNGLSNKLGSASELGSPASAEVDPFKAQLEIQKKQGQTSSISPFGK